MATSAVDQKSTQYLPALSPYIFAAISIPESNIHKKNIHGLIVGIFDGHVFLLLREKADYRIYPGHLAQLQY